MVIINASRISCQAKFAIHVYGILVFVQLLLKAVVAPNCYSCIHISPNGVAATPIDFDQLSRTFTIDAAWVYKYANKYCEDVYGYATAMNTSFNTSVAQSSCYATCTKIRNSTIQKGVTYHIRGCREALFQRLPKPNPCDSTSNVSECICTNSRPGEACNSALKLSSIVRAPLCYECIYAQSDATGQRSTLMPEDYTKLSRTFAVDPQWIADRFTPRCIDGCPGLEDCPFGNDSFAQMKKGVCYATCAKTRNSTVINGTTIFIRGCRETLYWVQPPPTPCDYFSPISECICASTSVGPQAGIVCNSATAAFVNIIVTILSLGCFILLR